MATQLEAMFPAQQNSEATSLDGAPSRMRVRSKKRRTVSTTKPGAPVVTDPVTAYLSKIGEVHLLDRAGEQRVAQAIEEGTWESFDALLSLPYGRTELLESSRRLPRFRCLRCRRGEPPLLLCRPPDVGHPHPAPFGRKRRSWSRRVSGRPSAR